MTTVLVQPAPASPGCHSKIGYLSEAVAERRVALEYAELNWTTSMIVSVSILRISRYRDLAVETLNSTRHCCGGGARSVVRDRRNE